MAATETHALRYVGTTGMLNGDVADATGESAAMVNGKEYPGIPRELAVRLLATADFEEVGAGQGPCEAELHKRLEAEDANLQPGAADPDALVAERQAVASALETGSITVAPDREPDEPPEPTPPARAKAEDLGVDLNAVTGTGQDGRIVVADVERHHKETAPPDGHTPPPADGPAGEPSPGGEGGNA